MSLLNFFIAGLGYIPKSCVDVFFGTTIGSIADLMRGKYEGGTTSIVMLIVWCAVTFILATYITLVIKRYFKRTAEKI